MALFSMVPGLEPQSHGSATWQDNLASSFFFVTETGSQVAQAGLELSL